MICLAQRARRDAGEDDFVLPGADTRGVRSPESIANGGGDERYKGGKRGNLTVPERARPGVQRGGEHGFIPNLRLHAVFPRQGLHADLWGLQAIHRPVHVLDYFERVLRGDRE